MNERIHVRAALRAIDRQKHECAVESVADLQSKKPNSAQLKKEQTRLCRLTKRKLENIRDERAIDPDFTPQY